MQCRFTAAESRVQSVRRARQTSDRILHSVLPSAYIDVLRAVHNNRFGH